MFFVFCVNKKMQDYCLKTKKTSLKFYNSVNLLQIFVPKQTMAYVLTFIY